MNLTDEQGTIFQNGKSGTVEVVHLRVLVPLDGGFGVTLHHAVQSHWLAFDYFSWVLWQERELGGN